MRRVTSCFLLLTAAACGAPEVERPNIAYAHLDLARHGHRVERLGDTLYAFGGFARGDAPAGGTRQAFSFDLPHGPWRARSDMRSGHAFFGSGALGGQLFALGPTVERYDTGKDRWIELPATKRLPKSHHATATWRGRLHVLGGYPADVAGHDVFDPVTGRIEAATALPGFEPGDHFHILAPLGGRLHAVGGLRGGGSKRSRAHHAFDGTAWTEQRSPPMELWGKFAAFAAVGATLYVFSLEGSVAYDAQSDTWRSLEPIPVVLTMPATVVLDGRIVVIGGSPLRGKTRSVQVYDPATDRWTLHSISER